MKCFGSMKRSILLGATVVFAIGMIARGGEDRWDYFGDPVILHGESLVKPGEPVEYNVDYYPNDPDAVDLSCVSFITNSQGKKVIADRVPRRLSGSDYYKYISFKAPPLPEGAYTITVNLYAGEASYLKTLKISFVVVDLSKLTLTVSYRSSPALIRINNRTGRTVTLTDVSVQPDPSYWTQARSLPAPIYLNTKSVRLPSGIPSAFVSWAIGKESKHSVVRAKVHLGAGISIFLTRKVFFSKEIEN